MLHDGRTKHYSWAGIILSLALLHVDTSLFTFARREAWLDPRLFFEETPEQRSVSCCVSY